MRKLLVVAGVLLLAAVVAKKSHLGSYVCTAWTGVTNEARNAIPTEFELQRIRGEIAAMDRDIEGMVNPLASDMTDIQNLRKDIEKTQTVLETSKRRLLDMTATLEKGEKLVIAGVSYSGDHARSRLQQDFSAFKRFEEKLDTQQQLLQAKEERFEASLAQAEKLMAKKREYEVRLARLEAEEERLQVERLGEVPQADTTRAAQIEEALRFVENRHQTEKNREKLRNGPFALDQAAPDGEGNGEANLQEIRSYLEGAGQPSGRLQDVRSEHRD